MSTVKLWVFCVVEALPIVIVFVLTDIIELFPESLIEFVINVPGIDMFVVVLPSVIVLGLVV